MGATHITALSRRLSTAAAANSGFALGAGRGASLAQSRGSTRRRLTRGGRELRRARRSCSPMSKRPDLSAPHCLLACAFAQKEQPHDGASRARFWCEPITAAGVVAAGVHSSAWAGSAGAAWWRLAMCFDSTVTLSSDTSSRMIDRLSS